MPAKRRKDSGKSIAHHASRNRLEIFASVTVFVIILTVLALFNYVDMNISVPQNSGVTASEEPKSQCMIDNPRFTQQDCDDMDYHDTAIATKDKALCEKIVSQNTKDHCLRYFQILGL
ncbi:MAG: hypothetical protein JW789_01945 [Candidatus Aenigmarchaeota archaeon]|nr:hypothetical protein [Candidatus Aenigmarchaeota archaeon]